MDKTILLIDDKPTIGQILKTYLEEDGRRMVYFENAPSAIEWLDEGNRPALIITDMRMPLMSGEEFLAFLKSNPLYKSIPVVILSSAESTDERIHAFEAGVDDYIVKQFNPLELKARIKKYL